MHKPAPAQLTGWRGHQFYMRTQILNRKLERWERSRQRNPRRQAIYEKLKARAELLVRRPEPEAEDEDEDAEVEVSRSRSRPRKSKS